ncbi:MAG: hypothetical protein JNN12_00235, partial [Bacteroidetes Order II. Incertae sedis bacterium]|nr:hypothetical protein [Bacteroidetes Order II. bacterium]
MPKNKITSTEKIGIPVFIYRHWGNLSVWQRKLLFVVGLFLLFSVSVQAQITGTVFRDFNGNGTKESAEPLVAGVEVKAYDTAGSQCGTTQTTTA